MIDERNNLEAELIEEAQKDNFITPKMPYSTNIIKKNDNLLCLSSSQISNSF